MTFAFVDVVGSMKASAEHGDAFVEALAVLQERVARHSRGAGGSVVETSTTPLAATSRAAVGPASG